MKKISLKNLNLKEVEQLSRVQLKSFLGGDGSGSPNPKQDACKGKKRGDYCYWTYNGVAYDGTCQAYAPNYVMHCSNLI